MLYPLTPRTPPPQELDNLNKWGLNIFRVSEFSNNRSLSCIMYTIFQVTPPGPPNPNLTPPGPLNPDQTPPKP